MRLLGAALALALVAAAVALPSAGCDNLLMGNLRPVPPVHRVPFEIEGRAVLVAEDAVIESRDPVHIQRANERRVPQDLRAAMTTALTLAGFKVVTSPDERHDLVARIALAVREESGRVHQTYRCRLRGPDGADVAQIDWAWPVGVYVAENEVYDYATHSLASEIATSRAVSAYLRGGRAGAAPAAAPPPATAGVDVDAGAGGRAADAAP